MMSRHFWSSHLLARGSLSTQALAGQIDSGGVVDDPVQDCVGVGRVADQLAPVLNRHLAGHYGRAPSVSVFQDFQQVVTASSIERLENPVVQKSAAAAKLDCESTVEAVRQLGPATARQTASAHADTERSGCPGRLDGRAPRPTNFCPPWSDRRGSDGHECRSRHQRSAFEQSQVQTADGAVVDIVHRHLIDAAWRSAAGRPSACRGGG